MMCFRWFTRSPSTLGWRLAVILSLWLSVPIQPSGTVQAVDVYLDLKGASSHRVDVAIPRFAAKDSDIKGLEAVEQIKTILMSDLENSSVFKPIDISSFYDSSGVEEGAINFKKWYLIGMQALVAGTFSFQGDELSLKAWIYDVPMGQEIIGKSYKGSFPELRRIVHRLADEMVYRFTGEYGIAGSRIAFVGAQGGAKELYLMDYDGYNLVQLTKDKNLNLSPALSPDGKYLAFTSYRSGRPDLVMMNLESKKVETLASGGLNIAPAFSADSSRIALSREIDGNPEIFLITLADRKTQRVTFYNGIDSSPSWSPNGRQIVFTSDRSGSPQLWIMDAEGSNLRRLTFIGDYNDGAEWSPRGDRIAFHSRQNGRFEICTISPDGSLFTQHTNNLGNTESPAWSPDGRHLVFSTKKGDTNKLLRLQLATGKFYEFESQPQAVGWTSPAWSK